VPAACGLPRFQVKVRDSAFRTITRQRTVAEPTDLAEPIWHLAMELARPEIRGRRIRLVGVGAHGLGEPTQLGLFAPDDDRRRRAVEATDALRRRFGEKAVTRARCWGAGSRLAVAIRCSRWIRDGSGGARPAPTPDEDPPSS